MISYLSFENWVAIDIWSLLIKDIMNFLSLQKRSYEGSVSWILVFVTKYITSLNRSHIAIVKSNNKFIFNVGLEFRLPQKYWSPKILFAIVGRVCVIISLDKCANKCCFDLCSLINGNWFVSTIIRSNLNGKTKLCFLY